MPSHAAAAPGDHKQLRPKVDTYELSVQAGRGHSLNVSLFERLVMAGLPHTTLEVQHRMHPDISSLIKHTYPVLQVCGAALGSRERVHACSQCT